MSKRNHKKQSVAKLSVPVKTAPREFGFEEMLSELEAIVAAAAKTQQSNEQAA